MNSNNLAQIHGLGLLLIVGGLIIVYIWILGTLNLKFSNYPILELGILIPIFLIGIICLLI